MALPPRTEAPRLEGLRAADLGELLAGDLIEGCRFTEVDLSSRDCWGSTFSECAFHEVRLDGTVFRGARFQDVELIGVRASELTALRSQWRDVRIASPRSPRCWPGAQG